MEEKKLSKKDIELKKLEDERQMIRQRIPQLDEEKNALLTRLIELQGIINYLNASSSDEEKK